MGICMQPFVHNEVYQKQKTCCQEDEKQDTISIWVTRDNHTVQVNKYKRQHVLLLGFLSFWDQQKSLKSAVES